MSKYIILIAILFFQYTLFAQCFQPDTNIWKDTWASCQKTANPKSEYGNSHWIQYDLGTARNLSKTWLWNTNDPSKLNQGFQQVKIDYSNDGENWTTWGDMNFPKANGEAIYGGFAGPDLQNVKARYVLITALSNYGHTSCAGLAEVKFNLLPSDDTGAPIREEEDGEDEDVAEEGEEEEENEEEGVAEEDGEDEDEEEEGEEEEDEEEGNEEDEDEESMDENDCTIVEEIEIEIEENEAFIFWETSSEQDFFFIQYGLIDSEEKEVFEIEESELYVENVEEYIGYELEVGIECGDDILWSEPIILEGEIGNLTTSASSRTSMPQGQEIKIFPNPTIGKFSFQYHSSKTDVLQYAISNIEGKVLIKEEYSLEQGSNLLQIDLSDVPDGIYFLNTITTHSGQVVNQKILKNSIK